MVRMRDLILTGLLSVTIAAGAAPTPPASGPAAGEQVLARSTTSLGPGAAKAFTVTKTQRDDGIYLIVSDASGMPVFTSENLGIDDKKFIIASEPATNLAIRDVTGDGAPEILTAVFYGPHASALYIFRYDPVKKAFSCLESRFPANDLVQVGVVSDVHLESGEDLVVLPGNVIRSMGRVYDPAGVKPPSMGYYYFRCAGDAFVFDRLEQLPPPPASAAPTAGNRSRNGS